MIELVFHDNTCGWLQTVKEDCQLPQMHGMRITMDDEGNYESKPHDATAPYEGPRIPGKSGDVLGLNLAAHVGKLSTLSDWQVHFEQLDAFWTVYEDADMEDCNWISAATHAATLLVQRLQQAGSNQTIRIWHSDHAEEACGFLWAMALLGNSPANVTEIKVPQYYLWEGVVSPLSSTGGLAPEQLVSCLSLERPISQTERLRYAKHWARLVAENAPLRAVVNGALISVPANFYDFVLEQALPDTPCRVAQVIGQCLHAVNGVNDWWYANRLLRWIDEGRAQLLEHKKPFYGSLVQRATPLREHN